MPVRTRSVGPSIAKLREIEKFACQGMSIGRRDRWCDGFARSGLRRAMVSADSCSDDGDPCAVVDIVGYTMCPYTM